MQGIHAEILALLDTRNPLSRRAILACYPQSVHPDAIHKAIFELVRSGTVNAAPDGLTLAKPPKDDEKQDRAESTRHAKRGGKASARKRGNAIYRADGLRLCRKCNEYLAPAAFNYATGVSDGLSLRCRNCVNSSRSNATPKPPRYNEIGLRLCACCKDYLQISEFQADHASKDGYRVTCKPCVRAQRRASERRRKTENA